jgi:hypothetical protein
MTKTAGIGAIGLRRIRITTSVDRLPATLVLAFRRPVNNRCGWEIKKEPAA